MKKTFLFLMTMLIFAFGITTKAQIAINCQVKAKFSFQSVNCKVKFTDASATASGTTLAAWNWDFGDGTTSTLQNPGHVYAASGTYTVCVTVVGTNVFGVKCKDKICLPVTITGCGQQLPCRLGAKFDFKIDKCTVGFSDFSAAGAGTTITNWLWDFGDGTTSALQHPTHTYTTSGTYTVCLTIVGNNGLVKCKDQFCLPVTVTGCEPPMPCGVKPIFKFKVDKCTVYFTDYSGTNPGTIITNWYWNFGDGTTSTVQHPTHVYALPGTYTVCLVTVAINTAGQQCKNEYCFPVTVESCGDVFPCKLAPKFDIKVDKCNVSFIDLSAVGVGTTITNWFWSFGDGNTSTLQNPSHTYIAPGTYTVCLTIVGINTAGERCKDQLCLPVTVTGCGDALPCKLGAKFDFKTDKCTVAFTDFSATGAGTTITNWFWDFGDGNTSVLQNPTHTYTTAGTYTVCLTIVGINAAGEQCKDRLCLKVTVEGCSTACKLSPKFDFKIDKCNVSFFDFSVAGPGTLITNWFWNFGDGSGSNLQNPTHTYIAPGTYTVCLTILGINPAGERCKDIICVPVTVEGCGEIPPCKLAAKFDLKIDKCTVNFTDYSAAGTGTTITNWFWDFGDGTSSNLQHPTHVYATAGTYTVCLIIVGTNKAGEQCKDRVCQEIKVEGCETRPCEVYAKFDFGIEKCFVKFTDYSAVGAGTTITNWYWDFGDGTSSTLQHPTHTYATAGTYTVCLVIVGTTATGEQCKDKRCDVLTVDGCGQIEPCKLAAKFDTKMDNCFVAFVDFSATGAGTTITNWYWNFGDGNTSTLQNPTHLYAAPGIYKVCLIVVGKNAAGEECKDEFCAEITVDCKLPGIVSNDLNPLILSVFPNPANDRVSIQFKMPKEGQANVTVTDMQGRTLFILQDGNLIAGFHTINWKVEAISGWYIITVKTNAGIEQKPLLIQQ